MKNFKRAVLGLSLAAGLGMTLVACGNQQPTEEQVIEQVASVLEGETVDSGLFKAFCPGSFMNIPQYDIFAEEDKDGNSPLNPKSLQFCYGATSEWDVLTNPCVDISLEIDELSLESIIGSLEALVYDNIEEKTFKINDIEYSGAEADFVNPLDENDVTHYQIVYVPIVGDATQYFKVTVPTKMGEIGDTGLNVDNLEIQSIIESVELSK